MSWWDGVYEIKIKFTYNEMLSLKFLLEEKINTEQAKITALSKEGKPDALEQVRLEKFDKMLGKVKYTLNLL